MYCTCVNFIVLYTVNKILLKLYRPTYHVLTTYINHYYIDVMVCCRDCNDTTFCNEVKLVGLGYQLIFESVIYVAVCTCTFTR